MQARLGLGGGRTAAEPSLAGRGGGCEPWRQCRQQLISARIALRGTKCGIESSGGMPVLGGAAVLRSPHVRMIAACTALLVTWAALLDTCNAAQRPPDTSFTCPPTSQLYGGRSAPHRPSRRRHERPARRCAGALPGGAVAGRAVRVCWRQSGGGGGLGGRLPSACLLCCRAAACKCFTGMVRCNSHSQFTLAHSRRLRSVCLVSKRFYRLCTGPQLLRHLRARCTGLEAAESLAAFLCKHGRHARSLHAFFMRGDENPSDLAAAVSVAVTVAGAGGQLQELELAAGYSLVACPRSCATRRCPLPGCQPCAHCSAWRLAASCLVGSCAWLQGPTA